MKVKIEVFSVATVGNVEEIVADLKHESDADVFVQK